MAKRETHSLIGSDKVDGTAVYGADQRKIGSVERVMIDKLSGKVAYAVISYGGFLGMGEEHYPTPWSNLKYDTNLGGYLLNLTKDQLQKAPKRERLAVVAGKRQARLRLLSRLALLVSRLALLGGIKESPASAGLSIS